MSVPSTAKAQFYPGTPQGSPPMMRAPQPWQNAWQKLSSRVYARMQPSLAEVSKEGVHKRLKLSPEWMADQGTPVSYSAINLSGRAPVTCFWEEVLRQGVQISHKLSEHFHNIHNIQKGIKLRSLNVCNYPRQHAETSNEGEDNMALSFKHSLPLFQSSTQCWQ